MQTIICKLLRTIMIGQATMDTNDGAKRTISNIQVLALFDLAPVHVELSVRRLRLFAGVVRDP